jgi:hypothetical protein
VGADRIAQLGLAAAGDGGKDLVADWLLLLGHLWASGLEFLTTKPQPTTDPQGREEWQGGIHENAIGSPGKEGPRRTCRSGKCLTSKGKTTRDRWQSGDD